MIGRTVSHYRVVEKLGGGGMGVVYRAQDTRLTRDVALKFLPTELTDDASARERFMLEARAASALDHANICTIYDIDETEDGDLFIAMAFYSGRTLKARLTEGPLTVEEAARIGSGVAAGLDRAHEAGIIHRDIKPANLMLTERGDVKILDFGIAKLLGESDLTRTGATLGTLGYMAPEQLEGETPEPATDLWSLGVVLYQGLAGQSPFKAESQQNLVAAILTKVPPPLRTLRPELPEAMEELVGALLEKDPERRPTPARAVAERLEALGRPAGASPASRSARRATWWVAAGALVALILALVIPTQRRARMEDARAQLQEARALTEERRYAEAYVLAAEVESLLGSDQLFQTVMELASDRLTVRTVPGGARLSIETFEEGRPVQIPES
ncbi:MAG: serine/threonine protein kinase, partial [Gemmatimonadetes bacterium]|nr:serine/threonine protein kinase [Gemmatimonadota bacterium]